MKLVTDPNILNQLNSQPMPQLPDGFVIDNPSNLKPVTDPALLEKLNSQSNNGIPQLPQGFVIDGQQEPEKSLWQKTKDAIKGNAEFTGDNVTNYEDWLWTQPRFGLNMPDFKTFVAGALGNDKDKEKSFFNNHSGFKRDVDKNGNVFFRDGDKVVYIDKPGLDAGDIADTFIEGATYSAGGVATAPIKSILVKVGTTTGVIGGINAANQKLAGRDEMDLGESAIAGTLGGATQYISPYIGKVFNWAKNKLTGNTSNMQKGAEIAKANNLNIDDAGLETLGKVRANLDKSVPDKAIVAEYVHGLKLTKGQATQNPQQLADEQILRNQNGLINKFVKVDDFNNAQVETNLRNMRANISGGVDDVIEPAVNAEIAKDTLVNTARTARNEFKQAYNDVGKLFVKKGSTEGLPSRLKNAVNQSGLSLDKEITKNANAAIRSIESGIGKMGKNAKAFSLKAFDNQRKILNNYYSPDMNKMDKMALTVVKRELDDWFYNSIDESLYSGSAKELGKLSKARGLMADYMKRFDNKDGTANKVIRNIIREDRTPEEFSNMLVGVNGYSKANSAKLVKAYKNAVGGADSEGFKALKAHVFEKMILGKGVNKATGQTNLKGSRGLVSTFNDAFSVKGKTLMKELYTNAEANEIKSLMSSVNLTNLRSELQNNSGSGLVVTRLVSSYGGNIPLISKFLKLTRDTYKGHSAFELPINQNQYTPELIGAGGTLSGMMKEK